MCIRDRYYALLGDFLLLEPEFCSGQILIVSFEDALLFLQGEIAGYRENNRTGRNRKNDLIISFYRKTQTDKVCEIFCKDKDKELEICVLHI